MKKHDLFIAGMTERRWRWRYWRISLFAITILPKDHVPVDYDIDYRKDGTYTYLGNKWVIIEDAAPNTELFNNRQLAAFPAGFFANHPDEIETTYGRALFNQMAVCYAFGSKLPFIHKSMPNAIAKMFIPRLIKEGSEPLTDDEPIYPKEVAKFVQAILETTSLCPYITPTGTERSLTTSPEVIALRDKLFDEYRDSMTLEKLVDIKNQLSALDREWLNDDSKDFYISNKAFDVTRMRSFITYGASQAFQDDGKFTLVEKSLNEEPDLTKITAKNNETREGSYDRGNNTAFGGAKANVLYRICQDVKVIETDCGAEPQPILINDYNKKHFINMNAVVNGTVVLIDEELIAKYMGKILKVRRPILCQAGKTDIKQYCAYCTTLKALGNTSSVKSMLYGVGSEIMYVFMKAMHGTRLSSNKFEFKSHIK